jgi:hypothetical protein
MYIFKGDKFPFKSPLLQTAYNELRTARMFSDDVLRMQVSIVEDRDPRQREFFNVREYGGRFDEDFMTTASFPPELDVIKDLKSQLRSLLYRVYEIEVERGDTFYSYEPDRDEEKMPLMLLSSLHKELMEYFEQWRMSLKKADQQLGLRLEEIFSQSQS